MPSNRSGAVMANVQASPAATAADDVALSYPSPLKEFWQGFSHNKGAVAGLVFMIAIAVSALLAPWLA
ncbi:MAG TPA: hypothetical protein VJ575_00410, partial [Pseudogulbenkiania sp.]|nr:hypothetical protein [Pseudogulbenkiania sp.]